MKVVLSFGSVFRGQRQLLCNEKHCHNISDVELRDILDDAITQLWKTDIDNGRAIGDRLFRLLDGRDGKMRSVLQDASACGESLDFCLNIPFDLEEIPFELLYHDNRFLLLAGDISIVRRVNRKSLYDKAGLSKRSLKVLFVACSPRNLPEGLVLDFQEEEEIILSVMENYPVDVVIEDSGTLEGIRKCLMEHGAFDVIHITGYAGIDKWQGPVFYMEDEVGDTKKITPDKFWDKIKDRSPSLLFLSGCSTGKGDKAVGTKSFACSMVNNGIPFVIGWGLPVKDVGATLMISKLYESLGRGLCLLDALQSARELIGEKYYPWPLFRLFSDGSEPVSFIASGQDFMRRSSEAPSYKNLADSSVKVLENGFLGRRRELQRGLRVLKSMEAARDGILITGALGLGKSCLCGKLLERFPDKELVVICAEVRIADFFLKLQELFDRRGMQKGLAILKNDKISRQEKIMSLFRQVMKELPVIFLFDDFQYNLDEADNSVADEAKEVLAPLLHALGWAEGKSNMVIISRYPFNLETDHNTDMVLEKLRHIPLMAFKGADLRRKSAQLPAIAESTHKDLYFEIAGGNPRRLEWLEKIAAKEADFNNIDELKIVIEGKSEEFVHRYLADLLIKTEGVEFYDFLLRSTVYRYPVCLSAFEKMGSERLLKKAVDLTIMEQCRGPDGNLLYWVNPVIRKDLWAKLNREDKRVCHGAACAYYENFFGELKWPSHVYLQEAVHHALESGDLHSACRYVVPLSDKLESLLLCRDALVSLEMVEAALTEEFIEQAGRNRDEAVADLFSGLGRISGMLGEHEKTALYYNKALVILK